MLGFFKGRWVLFWCMVIKFLKYRGRIYRALAESEVPKLRLREDFSKLGLVRAGGRSYTREELLERPELWPLANKYDLQGVGLYLLGRELLTREDIQRRLPEDSSLRTRVSYSLRDLFTPAELFEMGILRINHRFYTFEEFSQLKNLHVHHALDLENAPELLLPRGLRVGGYLNLANSSITKLPEDLTIGGSLYIEGTPIDRLPQSLQVSGLIINTSSRKQLKIIPYHLREKLRY